MIWVISLTENDDDLSSEEEVVAEEFKLPDELSFLAQEIIKRQIQQILKKIMLDLFNKLSSWKSI